jgi:predicted ester cyclase
MMRRAARLSCLLAVALLPACAAGPDLVPGPTPPPPSPAPTAAATATAAASATTPLPPARPPLAELQRAAAKGMAAAFNGRDAKKVAALYSPTVLSGTPGPAGWDEETGADSIEVGHTRLFAAFPDMKWASPRLYLKGDVAIQEWVSNATHKGDLGSMKATGKATGIHGISVYWFDEDGLIRRDNTYFDSLTIGRQTGSKPGTPRALPELPAGEMSVLVPNGSAEEGKRADAAKAMYAAFAGKDEKAFLALLDADVVQKVYSQPTDQKGHKAAADGYQAMQKAFPDLKVTPANVWAFGDRVVAEVVMGGTHKGDLGPIKATKKAVTLHSLDVLTFGKDGKITVVETYSGSIELYGQLGALGGGEDKAAKAAPAKKPAPKK